MVNFNGADGMNPEMAIDNAMTKINETKVTIRKLLKENQKAPRKNKSKDKINHDKGQRNESISNALVNQPAIIHSVDQSKSMGAEINTENYKPVSVNTVHQVPMVDASNSLNRVHSQRQHHQGPIEPENNMQVALPDKQYPESSNMQVAVMDNSQ